MARRAESSTVALLRSDDATIDEFLEKYPEVSRIAHAVYEPAGVRLFLTTPMPRFGGRTAIQLLEQGHEGKVLSALAADYEGLS